MNEENGEREGDRRKKGVLGEGEGCPGRRKEGSKWKLPGAASGLLGGTEAEES